MHSETVGTTQGNLINQAEKMKDRKRRKEKDRNQKEED